MACSTCGCNPCNCGTVAGCVPCECVDPGSIASFRHLYGLDYALCGKRLENGEGGILAASISASGQALISFQQSPCFTPEELELDIGETFGSITANLGELGCMRRLVPADAVDGWLHAVNGQWVIAALPATTVPDPLTLQNLSVQATATIRNLTVTQQICASATPTGTIDALIGLDSGGCIVRQASGGSGASPLTVSVAMYYENANEQSIATPNAALVNGGYAQIGNEIFDPDNIAQVQDQFTIKVLTAGKYRIDWGVAYNKTVGTNQDLTLSLELNGATLYPSFGDVFARANAAPKVFPAQTGFTVLTLAVNNTLKLKLTASDATACGAQRVKMMLTKFAA